MKLTLSTKIKTGMFAVAMACAGFSHAVDLYTLNGEPTTISQPNGVSFGQSGDDPIYMDVQTLNLGTSQLIAFCVQPLLGAKNVSYTQGGSFLSDIQMGAVSKLYAVGYASIFDNGHVTTTGYQSFQMALWEVLYDEPKDEHGHVIGNASMLSGDNQYFDNTALPSVAGAQLMLDHYYAADSTLAAGYPVLQYAGFHSQALIAAVPEADTWAMLAAGLGLIGLVGRRKSRQTEKFAR